MSLNPRQRAFADYYVEKASATEAAILAGYSEKYAGCNADKLLKNTKIKEYIDGKLEEIASKRIANATEVLETLTRVLRREEEEAVVLTVKTRTSGTDKNGNKKIVDKEEAKVIKIPTRISDVNKAAELIGKRYGLYTDKVDLSGGVDLRVKIDYGDSDDTGK